MIPLEELDEFIKTAENTLVLVSFNDLSSTDQEYVAILAMIDFIDRFIDKYKGIYESMTFSSEEIAIVYEDKTLTIEQDFIAYNNSISFDTLYSREAITKSLNKMYDKCYNDYALVRNGFKKIANTIYEYLREERLKLTHLEDENSKNIKPTLNKEELLSTLIDLTVGNHKMEMDIKFLRDTYYSLIKKIKDTDDVAIIDINFYELINAKELRETVFGKIWYPTKIMINILKENYKCIDIYADNDKIYTIGNIDKCTNDCMLEGIQDRVLLKNIIITLILILLRNMEMLKK